MKQLVRLIIPSILILVFVFLLPNKFIPNYQHFCINDTETTGFCTGTPEDPNQKSPIVVSVNGQIIKVSVYDEYVHFNYKNKSQKFPIDMENINPEVSFAEDFNGDGYKDAELKVSTDIRGNSSYIKLIYNQKTVSFDSIN